MKQITIRKPDDFHVHLRDGYLLAETVAASARCFGRVLVMPNLQPPILNAVQAKLYKERIQTANPCNHNFKPLMTLYLTDSTTIQQLDEAKISGVVACKLYPAGATTNSQEAVNHIGQLYPLFEHMQKIGLLLLVHGEVTESQVDIFDRESVFIEKYLQSIVSNFPKLKIVFEHITTRDAVQFVLDSPETIAATITVQHLQYNRNDLFMGGLKPHNYCLPILKRSVHQQALRDAVSTGSSKFFLGTDSAPHEKYRKESSCGCAGCYSAWSAIEIYAQIFEELGCLDKFERFASENGAHFYGLPLNEETITLIKQPWQIPSMISLATGQELVPFMAGETIQWKLS